MNQKKQWKDYSPMTRVRIIALGLVQVTLLAAALWDIRQRPAEAINGSKKLWYGLVFVNFVGPIAYFVVGRKRDAQVARTAITDAE
jgi:hypothetical protein